MYKNLIPPICEVSRVPVSILVLMDLCIKTEVEIDNTWDDKMFQSLF